LNAATTPATASIVALAAAWTGLENFRELKMYPQHRLPNPLEPAAAEKSAKPSLE
jgi:hypothetical protein